MKIIAGQPTDELELPFTPPLDWARMLRFFTGRATGGDRTSRSGAGDGGGCAGTVHLGSGGAGLAWVGLGLDLGGFSRDGRVGADRLGSRGTVQSGTLERPVLLGVLLRNGSDDGHGDLFVVIGGLVLGGKVVGVVLGYHQLILGRDSRLGAVDALPTFRSSTLRARSSTAADGGLVLTGDTVSVSPSRFWMVFRSTPAAFASAMVN